MTRRTKLIGGALVAAILIGVVAVVAFIQLSGGQAEALPEAESALVSDESVAVELEPWITLTPSERARTGFILYPGARVDPAAYAPSARAIADQGYLTVIVPMPFGIAALGADKATDVMEAFPEVERWVVGGHSIGGAMAMQYTDDNVDRVAGVALWGAYPSPDDDISTEPVLGVSVYASEDGLSTVEEIEDTAQYLPQGTDFVLIEGGNHTNFGLYETQDGDGVATIPPAEQQSQTVAATLKLLDAVEAADG